MSTTMEKEARIQNSSIATTRRRRWRPGLLVVLVAIVAVPLIFSGRLLVADLNGANADRAAAREFVPQAKLRVAVIRLGAALMNERAWAIGNVGLARVVAPGNPGLAGLKATMENNLEAAVATTDWRIRQVPQFRRGVAEARASASEILAINDKYESLMADVSAFGELVTQQLQTLAMSQSDGAELIRTLSLAESVADAELSSQAIFAAYMPSTMSKQPENFLRTLIEQRGAYESAIADIDRFTGDSGIAGQVASLRASTAEHGLLAAVDARISAVLGQSESSGPRGVALEQLRGIAAFVASASSSRDAWVTLTGAVGSDLVDEARALEQESASAIRSFQNMAIGAAVITLLLTLAGTALVLRSVRRLARGAQAIRDGDMSQIRPSGPFELYIAGKALSEASANIDLVRRQAAALAAGDLLHPDLLKTAPSELGVNMKTTIDTLRGSIEQREDAQLKAAWQANHDALTGLPNRAAALDLVKSVQEKRHNSAESAVLFIDLDGFKTVNDTFGHSYGDEVLVEVARRLRSHSRAADVACRIGGDEFVVVMAGVVTESQAQGAAERFVAAISADVALSNGERASVGASVGIAITGPDLAVAEILHNADIALHEAKASGRDSTVKCTPRLLESVKNLNDLTTELRTAVDNEQFHLEFQPVVDTDGFPVSLEALIRWDHPVRGTMMPDEFIPVAERSDLILAIDRWVVLTAATQIAAWSSAEPFMDDVMVAINVSSRHLTAPSFLDDILDPIHRLRIDPSRLLIEITESFLMDNLDQTRYVIERLRSEGFKIGIDDFGTGYSGITELRALPIDLIKIDKSFIDNITDREGHEPALIGFMVDIARELGVKTTAEGIETVEQARAAASMGFDSLQGWLFSRSVEADHVPSRLAQLGRLATAAVGRPGPAQVAGVSGG